MPVISPSSYQPPLLLSNGHLQTIFPNLFRTVNGVSYDRERITTPDDDCLDLDWSKVGSTRLAILLHGLEGHSRRPYMLGMVRALNENRWDALAMNFRGCSGKPNRKIRSYHSGFTDDLHTVIHHALAQRGYSEIALIGFSLGGNVTLKYLGERGDGLHPLVTKAVAFSVPCDLKSGARQAAKFSNRIYMEIFLRSLHEKIKLKMRMLPGQIDDTGYDRIKTFKEFDDRYTAPIHGFRDAEEYWQRCSSRPFLPHIRIPTLVISARNDPLLAEACYPVEAAKANSNLFLEIPASGGHVGFVAFNDEGRYWSESRAVSFLNERR